MRKTAFVTASTVSAVFVAIPAHAGGLVDKPAHAATLPAVSAPNWKAAIAGGYIDEYDVSRGNIQQHGSGARVHGEFSYAAPVTFSTGFQLDGSIGDMDGETTGGVGAHYFTRDPDSHLLGIVGGYAAIGNNDIVRVGPEAEFYFDRTTIQAAFGFEDSDDEDNELFAFANLAYYPHDDLKVYVGYRRTLTNDAAAAGFELLTRQPSPFGQGMSLFAEGQVGDDNHSTVWAGLRFYFGEPDKSLIRRHREDDPVNLFPILNQLAGQCLVFDGRDAVINDSDCIPIKKGLKKPPIE